MDRDIKYMQLALECARQAAIEGEVPVGAVCVLGDELISIGYNRREGRGSAIAHAEVEAIRLACERLGGWNLWRCELYVTLEPCVMCAGAIINSRIGRVIYGARDIHSQGAGAQLLANGTKIVSGVLEDECAGLLSDFFSGLRKEKSGWKPSERVLLGEAPPPMADISYEPYVCAVVPCEHGFVLIRRGDGLYEFPSVMRAGKAPAAALREKCPGVEPGARLLTVVEQCERDGRYIVRDNIFLLCGQVSQQMISEAWAAPVGCAASGVTFLAETAINKLKEIQL